MQSVLRSTASSSLAGNRKELAQKLVDRVFDSLRQMNVVDGVVQDYSVPEMWTHRTTRDIERDLAYLEIDRQGVLTAFSEYLDDSSLRTREIDWLFLNLLTYAEYIATVAEIRKKLLGIEMYVKSLHPPKDEHTPSISVFASRPWHTFSAAGVTVLSILVHPAAAVGVGAMSAFWYWRRSKRVDQLNTALSSMLRTYVSFNTVDLSWTHVTRILEESRQAGAVWDSSLFRLSEDRQSAT